MKGAIWTDTELKELKELVAKGWNKERLAEYFDRTPTSIELKVRRSGFEWQHRGRNWTSEDVKSFKDDWNNPSYSKIKLIQKYNRSWMALRNKATKLHLGARPQDLEYLTVTDICSEMNVSDDRVYRWIELGLKTRKVRSGRGTYKIKVEDLLDFLKEHQDLFNAADISEFIFFDMPDWLLEKRNSDKAKYANRNRREYTNDEDSKIQALFNMGFSDKEIAERLNRTECGIMYHRYVLGLIKDNSYIDKEIDTLKELSKYYTLDELSEMLNRPRKSIEYKCKELNLPYHFSKAKCERKV